MALDRKRKRGHATSAKITLQRPETVDASPQDVEMTFSDHDEFIASGSDVLQVEVDEDVESNAVAESSDDGEGPVQSSTNHATRRPPTALELREIKDASDLYRSSSFKLQIDALLPNVRPVYHKSDSLDHFLASLHTFLNALPSISPQHPLEAAQELSKKGVSVPYVQPLPTHATKWKVSFERPSGIVVAGSWPNKLSVKAQDKQPFSVDLALEMPSSLFQEKDYLHGRFFQKRAFFLSVLAAAIRDEVHGLGADALFSCPNGDLRCICLVIRPKEGSANDLTISNVQVRIIPTLSPTSPIPIQRLSPAKSNIRITSASDNAAPDTPSPLYNNTLHLSVTPKNHLLRSHSLKALVPAYADALTLLRVWANQRGYSRGRGLCVEGFESASVIWSSILDLLISGEDPEIPSERKTTKRKPIGKGLSSYQLFRAALDILARQDFVLEHVFIKSDNRRQFSPEEYPADIPVLVDSTGLNVLASVPRGSLDMLRHDASSSLDILNENFTVQDPFKEVFLKDHRDQQTRFDVVLRVDISNASLSNPSVHTMLDHGSQYNALLSILLSTLRRGLGDRVKVVVCLHAACVENPTSDPKPIHSPVIYIGLILNVEHAFRLVDHGPAADNPDPEVAKRFRSFWGDKAELRRFKDGSIVESVVWDVKTSDERTKIPYFISSYLLDLHCGIPQSHVQCQQDSFDTTLRLPESITLVYQVAKSETGFKAAMGAFDRLVKRIKALDDELPLAVLNVSPVSEMLRYTNVFTPTSFPASMSSALPECAQYLPAMDVIIEFEKSGRWPDDLRAIQKVKLAMFERLASKLMEKTPGLKATVVVGDPVYTSDVMDTACLEIILPEGWAFSARLWHDREATLLDNAIDDRPHIPAHVKRNLPGGPDPKLRQAALNAKEVYVRRFIHGPRHHRAVAALCHRYTAYAGTVRLVKRWLASHWVLQRYISVEAVELLCATVFIGSARDGASRQQTSPHAPATKERGFAKVVKLLKEWKWEEGIFVPLYSDEQNYAAAPRNVLNGSGRDGVWKIYNAFDSEGCMWTRDAPDAVMARHIQKISNATWSCLQSMEIGSMDIATIFAHPVQQYDFVIELNSALLPRYYQNVHADLTAWVKKGKYANAAASNNGPRSVQSGYDPARLLFNDLSRVYKDTFMLFHDPLGGDRFGGVWDPRLKDPRPFKILGKFSSTPSIPKDTGKDKTLVALNKAAILREVERLGVGLITGIAQRDQ